MLKSFLALLALLTLSLCVQAQYPAPPNVGLLANRPTFCALTGQQYYATDNSTLYYSTVAGTNCTWTAVGGSGAGVPSAQVLPNMNDVYVSPNCGTQVNCFTANPNLKATKSCVFTQNGTTITDATDSPWVAGDQGKKFWGVYTPSHVALVGSADGTTTIATVNSSSSITLADAIIGGVGTVTMPCVWASATQSPIIKNATDYAFALSSSSVLISASNISPDYPYRPKVIVAPGNYYVNGPLACTLADGGGKQGVGLIGSGVETKFYPGPDFAFTNSGQCGLLFEYNYTNYAYSDFSIDSLQLTLSGEAANQGFISQALCANCHMERIVAYGPGTTNSNDAILFNYSSTGQTRIADNFITGNPVGFSYICNLCTAAHDNNYFGNSHQSDEWIGSGFNDSARNQSAPVTITNHRGDESSASTAHVFQAFWGDIRGGFWFGNGGTTSAVSCDGTTLLSFDDSEIAIYAGNNNTDTVSMASGCKMKLRNTVVSPSGTGVAFNVASGTASMFDGGGNDINHCSSVPVCTPIGSQYAGGAGTLKTFGSSSITGTTQTTGNITPTGWGSGASTSAASGTSQNEQFTITIGTGAGANATAAVVFPTPFYQAPICNADQNGGTSTTVLPISVGTPTTTGVTLTYVGTFVTGTVITNLMCSN